MSTSKYTNENLPPFIQHWKQAIEAGNTPEQIAQLYHKDAILKGTVADVVVRGRPDITNYFVEFTAGKNDAAVTFNTLYESPAGAFAGEYTFSWRDDNGNEASANANYTFEPSSSDETALISSHHSSFLPSEHHA